MTNYTIMIVHNSKGQERFYPAIYLDKGHNWTQNLFPGRVFKTSKAAVNAAEKYLGGIQ